MSFFKHSLLVLMMLLLTGCFLLHGEEKVYDCTLAVGGQTFTAVAGNKDYARTLAENQCESEGLSDEVCAGKNADFNCHLSTER